MIAPALFKKIYNKALFCKSLAYLGKHWENLIEALCFFQNKGHAQIQQILYTRRYEDGFKNINELSFGTFPNAFIHTLDLIIFLYCKTLKGKQGPT